MSTNQTGEGLGQAVTESQNENLADTVDVQRDAQSEAQVSGVDYSGVSAQDVESLTEGDVQAVEAEFDAFRRGDLTGLVDGKEEIPTDSPVSEITKTFDVLTDELGHVDDLKHDGFYSNITQEHIKELPTVARRMLHNFRIAYALKEKEINTKLEGREQEIEGRKQRLLDMEREFTNRQAEFSKMVDDPRIQEAIAMPQGELPDPFTAEGIEARIQRGIANGMQKILEPMQEAASDRQKESNYLKFLESHPEMGEESFKQSVADMVMSRKKTAPISTQDAFQIVKARRVLRNQAMRTEQERSARAEAARRIGTATASGTPSGHEIPPEIKKQGAYAIATWLRDNPETAQRLRREYA